MNHNDYLDAGMHIIPIHPLDQNGDCSCGNQECPDAAKLKHPVMSNWQHPIDWDDDQIDCMETMTGSLRTFGVLVDGYMIIDVDPRNGGVEGYKELCAKVGYDPADKSGFVVHTGGGGTHVYFKAPEGVQLKSHLKDIKGIDFKCSGFVIGCGSLHASGSVYECDKGHPDDINELPAELINLLERTETHGSFSGDDKYSDDEISSMLECLDPDVSYEDWVSVGMAIHHATDGARIDLFDTWSSRGDKYEGYGEIQFKWDSFTKSDACITIGSLVFMAQQAGWVRPVTFTASDDEIAQLERAKEAVSSKTGCPVDIGSVDIYNPPGFVGTITNWINRNCLYPRKRLAAMAALHSIGGIAGINHVADVGMGKTQLNLFSIGLADSGTGKQAIIDCCTEIFKAAGLADTISGDIRSAKAIYEGLLRHGPFHIIMDEAGEIMGKATGKNKADYQTATSGVIMAALTASKTLTCDVKLLDDARDRLAQKLANFAKANSENEMSDSDFEDAKTQIMQATRLLDGGINDPFFSVYGMSTESTFRHVITLSNIQSGLVSRGVLVQEPDENPWLNPEYEPSKLPPHAHMKLAGFMATGQATTQHIDKIMRAEHKKVIRASDDAKSAISELAKWFHDVAQEHADNGTGMTPVIRRCLEKVIKIAAICGAADGEITLEHVRYATAFVVSTTADLIRRAESIAGAQSKQADERKEGLYNSVAESIMKGGTKTAIIRSVARDGGYKRSDVETCIDDMLDKGLIEEDKDAPRRSNRTIIYKLSNPEVMDKL